MDNDPCPPATPQYEKFIRIPEALRKDPEVARLEAEILARSTLVEREERMKRMVEAIRALVDHKRWVQGTDTWAIPGDVADRFLSILERCEQDFAEEIVWVKKKDRHRGSRTELVS